MNKIYIDTWHAAFPLGEGGRGIDYLNKEETINLLLSIL